MRNLTEYTTKITFEAQTHLVTHKNELKKGSFFVMCYDNLIAHDLIKYKMFH